MWSNWKLLFAPSLFKVTHFTSLISACMSNVTNHQALRRPLYSWSATHQSSRVRLVFILLIMCDDLPVLVGVQSVEEIVTAVLPWSVRELEDRQEWKIKAVFTQWTAIRQTTFNAYNSFLLQPLTAIALIWKTTCCSHVAEKPCSHVMTRLKHSLKENKEISVRWTGNAQKIPPLSHLQPTFIFLFILLGATSDFKTGGINLNTLLWGFVKTHSCKMLIRVSEISDS